MNLLIAIILGWPAPGEVLLPCDPAYAVPRWTLVLPDGSPVPVAYLDIDLEAMGMKAYGDPTIFCSNFED